jgi:hypothetical protein
LQLLFHVLAPLGWRGVSCNETATMRVSRYFDVGITNTRVTRRTYGRSNRRRELLLGPITAEHRVAYEYNSSKQRRVPFYLQTEEVHNHGFVTRKNAISSAHFVTIVPL